MSFYIEIIKRKRPVLSILKFSYECLAGSKEIHKRDRSGDSFEGEQGCHSDHGGPAVYEFRLEVPFLFFLRKLVLQAQVIKVQVTRSLSGLSSEIVARMSHTFTFSNGDKSQDSSKPDRLFLGKHAKGLSPVRLLRKTGEVEAKSKSSLGKKKIRS